ncbi:dihydroxyacetone kinase subunit DhaL [Mycobacterium sp. AT1]|uniref:dihydroxyacetone kinase subunit DhaL n=1 Tax=Mycobacterium sp. AT1 TaxID=1961706 RepID=UPI0009AE3790|nr:dihydroxyacetone kinase subunit DhaL [Mycobacterium sp. AT1]OPX09462.1 dihydroxyacetone kinase subunit L [Mycobacterium sp. AT1]
MAATIFDVDRAVRVMAETVVANEKYFGDLDAVVGDGDFGYSMARGFEIVLADWDTFDRSDASTFLKKVAVVITSRIGGTSGPIWGTGFLRAATCAAGAVSLDMARIAAMLDAAVDGIKARGGAELGDKTLLDALAPTAASIAQAGKDGLAPAAARRAAADTARSAAEGTRELQARRGRASYTGERSIGTLDAGAVAVAVIVEAIAEAWQQNAADA